MNTTVPRAGHWTVADIGGTHARLASWSAPTGLGPAERLRNDDVTGPMPMLADWLRDDGDDARQLMLALAMPVSSSATSLTNRAWEFAPDALIDALQLSTLVIVNDFVAAAGGLDALAPDEIAPLNDGYPQEPPTARLVIGPGTGLGAAAVVADRPQRVLASEAGHMSLAPIDALSDRLLAAGRARWGRVSWERMLSGDGLSWIDASVSGRDVPDAAANVARRAEAGESGALTAVQTFSRLLGVFAGDLCLAFQALDGVYLCGGVLDGIRASFDRAAFLSAFADKGRYRTQLARVPCFFAAGHELGLQGAARYLSGLVDMPAREWTA